MPTIEHIIEKRPRAGSDYSLAITHSKNGHDLAIFTALDTIGRPSFRGMKRLIKDIERGFKEVLRQDGIDSIDALAKAMRDEILRLNKVLQELTDEPLFGFGMATLIVFDNRCRSLWLGDCRSYLIRPTTGALKVRCLTRDQNKLCDAISEKESYVFLQNEFQELSRTLNCFWGMRQEEHVAATLDQQVESFELQPRDILLVLTDGVFLPICRSLLEFTNYRITWDDFTLENWLTNFIDGGGYLPPKGGPDQYKAVLRDLIIQAEKFTSRKSRYRDDIACVAAYVAKV